MAKQVNRNECRDKFLREYGIDENEIVFRHRERGDDSWSNSELFTGDKKGNMRIYYPTLDGYLEQHNKKGEMHDTFRVRLANPFMKDGKPVKYLMDGKNCIFFPPQMVQAYQAGTEIPVLCITEGEKKAFVAARCGFDIVGISGIWNFCTDVNVREGQQSELMPSLKEFIKKCRVQKVVLLHDSDALDISESANKAATDRPSGFYQSVKRCAELVFQEGCKFYYSYINPHLSENGEKLGLDDLLKLCAFNHRVAFDFVESVEEARFTSYFCTTKIEYIKPAFIKEIFRLNDPEDFYKYHKKALASHKEFRFEHRLFRIDHTTHKLEEIKERNRDNVWVSNGCYRGTDVKGNEKTFSNFTMNVLFLLRSSTNPKRIVEFKNIIGQACVKELTMEDFVSVSSFRKKLIADGSFIFKGDMYELLNLQEMLFKEEKTASELTSLGWQKAHSFFAWSNGLTAEGRFYPIDEYGIVQFHEDRFYLPAYSNLYSDADETFKNERNFKHIDTNVNFEQWAGAFYRAYKHNGLVGICFYVAALFRDLIFDEYNEFPLLNLFGQKGSGKSTMAKSLMYMFGHPQPAISLENASSTKKGMYRKFSQFRNAIVWLDEYKNNMHPDLIGLLKNLYDGIGYERAQTSQDNRTHNNPVLSSAIISGQDMPTIDPALFTRVVLLMFRQNVFTEADRAAYNEIKELEKKGLTCITNELIAHRSLIAQKNREEFKKWLDRLNKDFKLDDMPDRLLKNAAMILAPVSVFVEEKLIKFPVSMGVLYAAFTDVLKQHKALLNDNQEISQFWNVVEALFFEGIVSAEKGHFTFIQDCIAVRFNLVYQAYSEKYRKLHGRNGLDKMTLDNYLQNDKAFVEVRKSVRFENSVTSGYIFKYKILGIDLQKQVPTTAEPPAGGSPSIHTDTVADF